MSRPSALATQATIVAVMASSRRHAWTTRDVAAEFAGTLSIAETRSHLIGLTLRGLVVSVRGNWRLTRKAIEILEEGDRQLGETP